LPQYSKTFLKVSPEDDGELQRRNGGVDRWRVVDRERRGVDRKRGGQGDR
jgi:hypothetical protein